MPLEEAWSMSTIATSQDCNDVLPSWTALRQTRQLLAVRPWHRALSALTGPSRFELGTLRSFEHACVVPDDPGEVVRGARPISSHDRERMREQQISRLLADFRR
jgi:hypothetical protein